MLQRTDWFTQEKAATLLTAILAARPYRGTAETPLPPLVMNGASSSSGHHAAAPPPVPTPTAESEAVQNILVTFVDWLTSQLRCGIFLANVGEQLKHYLPAVRTEPGMP